LFLSLANKHTVKGVAMVQWQPIEAFHGGFPQFKRVDIVKGSFLRDIFGRGFGKGQFADRFLDQNFPKRNNAEKYRVGGILDRLFVFGGELRVSGYKPKELARIQRMIICPRNRAKSLRAMGR
jgi:hypothetical protein